MDPARAHTGWIELPLRELGILPDRPFTAHDLLSDRQYSWQGAWNYVELNPHVMPAHVFLIQQSD
jgi:starch synthase (maltosyl-transferring)